MFGVRHILRGCVAPALLALTLAAPAATRADTPNLEIADPQQALEFIDRLAIDAYDILGDDALGEQAREERLRELLGRGFNTRYIALFALGRHGHDLEASRLGRLEEEFDRFLLHKYARLVNDYGIARFRTVQAERAGRRDALVHMIVEHPGGAIETAWRVRVFDGEMRIIDVSVAGFSLAQSERAEFAQVIEQFGLDGLIKALNAYPPDRDV